MSYMLRSTICLIISLFMFTGCVSKPVRHLASDASLIKEGVSTRDDVYGMLGDPDAQRVVSEGVEEWVYYEEEATSYQRLPVVGSRLEVPVIKGVFDSKGYGMIVLTLKGELVTSVRYDSYEKGDYDWTGDFPWQEKKGQ